MSRATGWLVEGTVVESLPAGLFRVELPNGHRLLGHVARRERARAERLRAGQRVRVRLTPYDLSQGRLVLSEATN